MPACCYPVSGALSCSLEGWCSVCRAARADHLPPRLPSSLPPSTYRPPRLPSAHLVRFYRVVDYSEDISANVGALEELQAAYHCDFLVRSFVALLDRDPLLTLLVSANSSSSPVEITWLVSCFPLELHSRENMADARLPHS